MAEIRVQMPLHIGGQIPSVVPYLSCGPRLFCIRKPVVTQRKGPEEGHIHWQLFKPLTDRDELLLGCAVATREYIV